MLPTHSALHVAESFKVLEALHPGRIDLGIGRAPGTDAATAYALRRGLDSAFSDQMADLLAFAGGGFPAGHPFEPVRAHPAGVELPPVWILGSSEHGAQVAAALGVGFAFAHHLNPRGAASAIARYRETFVATGRLAGPRSILTLSAIAADTSERAEALSWSLALGVIRLRQGCSGPLPTPEEAMAHDYTADEADQVRRYRRAQTLGTGEEVRARLGEMVEETGADELMIMSTVHDHDERVRSYELISAAFETSVARDLQKANATH